MTSSKQQLIISLLICVNALIVKGQDGVSIGRPSPDPSAVLHISSPNKGVLFPDGEPVDINNISNPANGLFIYDRVFNRYVYRKANTWMYLNPWDTEAINPDNGPAANENITAISTPYEVRVNNDLSADHLDGFGTVPLGGIIMWSGLNGDIPSNFRLCDGRAPVNGINIPDLVGRFVKGGTGGAAEVEGGNHQSSSTSISYVETPEFRQGGSDCQNFEFIYRATVTVPCDFPEGTSDEVFVLTRAAASCSDVFFALLETLPGVCGLPPDIDIESSCTQSPNPNYYLTNPACRNNGVREVSVVTNTDNQPLYYELAYIIRVD
ncbi:hypothetical protein [Ekhidna sp.]